MSQIIGIDEIIGAWCESGDGDPIVLADVLKDRERKLLAEHIAVLEKIKEPLERNILKYPLDPRFPADRVNYSDAKLAVLDGLSIITAEIGKIKGD
jgi:hypothetical protein